VRVVTFGEVMLRLSPEDHLRIRQAVPGRLEATFGGGELNVAVSIAVQGGEAAFLTALPDNEITDSFLHEIRRLGVDTDLVRRADSGRFGIYFVETGADQRGGTVTYDRTHSSISLQPAEAYDWEAAFAGADWFHITGITPAISAPAAESAIAAVQNAQQHGLTVSCDLNFRKKLWNWDDRRRVGRVEPFRLRDCRATHRRTVSQRQQSCHHVTRKRFGQPQQLGRHAVRARRRTDSLRTEGHVRSVHTVRNPPHRRPGWRW
jgi:sugar/nucleoside kinase (ribokinase family)